jgi:hypothetical protein
MFHDVVPTGVDEPRISVAADLIPVAQPNAAEAAR